MHAVCCRCGLESDAPLCRNCLAKGYTKDIPKDRIFGGGPIDFAGVRKESDYNHSFEITKEDADLSPRQKKAKESGRESFRNFYDEDEDYDHYG